MKFVKKSVLFFMFMERVGATALALPLLQNAKSMNEEGRKKVLKVIFRGENNKILKMPEITLTSGQTKKLQATLDCRASLPLAVH